MANPEQPSFLKSNQSVTPSTGGHDYTKDPKGPAPATRSPYPLTSRPQQVGTDDTISADSVPAGGRILKADPSGPAANTGANTDATHKPFRLKEATDGQGQSTPGTGNGGDVGSY